MTEQDVADRSELASYLGKECWPCDGPTLLEKAATMNAPETVLNRLRSLPTGQVFENVQQVWSALQGGVEARRF